MNRVGFIGTGNMGFAIIKGIVGSEFGTQLEVSAFDSDETKTERLIPLGVEIVSSAQKLADSVDYLFLCVKPQSLGELLSGLSIPSKTVIVSICAGISAEYIRQYAGDDARVVPVMPNTPLLLMCGATALAKCKGVSDEEFGVVKKIFEACGLVTEVAENKMKEVIAINSSSPAFIYLFSKCFVDYGESVGIGAKASLELFAKALEGSAKMLTESGFSPDELIKMVSSPGGTTLAGLDKLYGGSFESDVRSCCEACTKRAYELSKS